MNSNYTIRDEIRDYWSPRAATFDLDPGHEIFSVEEKNEWYILLLKHLGDGAGRHALDLACGTGVISHLLNDLGFQVCGLDWSDAMLAVARQKANDRQANIKFVNGDAERTQMAEGHFDVIVMRHLVWTLVDPETAFSHWLKLLKPGGKLLIIDGDFVQLTRFEKIRHSVDAVLRKFRRAGSRRDLKEMRQIHQSILSQVYFKDGAKSAQIVSMLKETGFSNVETQTSLSGIHAAQRKHLGVIRYLERTLQHRYAICAIKPESTD